MSSAPSAYGTIYEEGDITYDRVPDESAERFPEIRLN